ncbi:MAG: putative oxidoreductase, Rieske [2Fe-2S] region [Ilumatobacteraceae bacterium]|nr:putative oxidoreductase, Rieske [2Fe-2S] region [Ilumatobacteraceae bacterium]
MRTMPVLHNTSPELGAAWFAVAHGDEVDATGGADGADGTPIWLLGRRWDLRRDAGELTATPADGQHPAAAVVEHLGLVWIAPETPNAPLPPLPGWHEAGFLTATCATVRTPVSAVQLIDNFMDAAHFPFVHPASFGVEDAFEVNSDEIVREDWLVRSAFTAPYQNHDDPLVATGEHPLVQPHEVTKVGYAACNASLELRFPMTDGLFTIMYSCQPETAGSTRVYKVMARNDLGDDAAAMARCVADEDAILQEDLNILERYTAMHLELDLTREVHTKADRLSVAWRRLMADLASTHDVAHPPTLATTA